MKFVAIAVEATLVESVEVKGHVHISLISHNENIRRAVILKTLAFVEA